MPSMQKLQLMQQLQIILEEQFHQIEILLELAKQVAQILGMTITNSGTITATNGSAIFGTAAGNTVTITNKVGGEIKL